MKKIKTNLILILTILLLGTLPIFAADNPTISNPNIYPLFGLKLGFGSSNIGIGLRAHLFYASNQENYIKLGATGAAPPWGKIESSGSGIDLFHTSNHEKLAASIAESESSNSPGKYPVNSYEILYGRFYQTGIITTSMAIGLSCSSYESKKNILGIPIEAELNFVPFFLMGIGLSAYVNLNMYDPFYVISFNGIIGKLM